MSDYGSNIDACRQAGYAYALACIARGDTAPLEAPFSGEWADGLTGQDVLDMAARLGADAVAWEDLDDFAQSDVLDAWEDGYFSADWSSEVAQ